jgi:hypothetical protein
MATTKFLTNNDLLWAAATLRCELAAIRAVDEVESNGRGFDKNGNVTIRFETAKFRDRTGKTIVGSGREAFSKAFAINPKAAMESTSWGRYQIMGFNHETVGFDTVEAFVDAMKTGERAQLEAFVKFVVANKIDDNLRALDFEGFKKVYNGPGKNSYAADMRTAYKRYQGIVLLPNDNLAPIAVKK